MMKTMTLSDLAALIHKVRGSATVEITSITDPGTSKGMLFGIVKHERRPGHMTKHAFHNEEELRQILEARR